MKPKILQSRTILAVSLFAAFTLALGGCGIFPKAADGGGQVPSAKQASSRTPQSSSAGPPVSIQSGSAVSSRRYYGGIQHWPAPTKEELVKSQQEVFDYLDQTLKILAKNPDQFPERDPDMYGKKKFLFDAVQEYYNGLNKNMQEYSKVSGTKSICQLLRVEDNTEAFRKKYAGMPFESDSDYYCNAYQVMLEISEDGNIDSDIEENPRQVAVGKDENGHWSAGPAMG